VSSLLGRALLFVVLASAGIAAAADVTNENRIKAAFLYKFPQFVEWPSGALEGRRTFDLCVLGPNPFGTVLNDLTAGEVLGGRPFAVRRVDADAARGCQVLFLPEANHAREAVLRGVATLPVLTVSDAPAFLDEGGIIQLRVVGGRIRFDISVAAATRAGLRLSAQLLQLADTVRGGRS
jgi:YfiR/HmsC-like